MSLDIRTTTDIKVAAKFVANKILKQLHLGKNVLWFVPGGSAIAVVVEASKIIAKSAHKNLTVILADERYGPIGHKDSNWQQILEKGFDLPQAKLVPILCGDDSFITTKKFNSALEKELTKADYKIGLFGVGTDGHTAGILPNSEVVNAPSLVFSYKTPQFERITITPQVILKLNEAVIFMQGKEKWKIVEDLNKDNLQNIDINVQPVQILKKVPTLTMFTDYKKLPKATWCSKFGVILILVILILVLYVGMQYKKTVEILIEDPFKYYLNTMTLSAGDDVYRIDVDLTGDEYKEILLSDSNSLNGKAGYIWQVFINNKNENYYLPTSSDPTNDLEQTLISFRSDAVGYALMPGDSIKSLVTYAPSNATTGSLEWYKIIDSKIVKKYQAIEPQGKDQALYDKLIQNPATDPASQIKIQDIHISTTMLSEYE